jgi:tetratricopeptide (TPR) repeat protein
LRLEGSQQSDPNSEQGKESLRKGMEGLKVIITNNPSNWPAHWMLGKAYQTLNQHEEAYKSFLAAHRNVLTKHDVLRELGLECLQTKRFSQAVHYCHVAIEFDLEDATLWPNMAVAMLFNNRLDEAEHWAKKALAKIPDDIPATTVLRIVGEIRAGTRGIPTDFDKLCRGEE